MRKKWRPQIRSPCLFWSLGIKGPCVCWSCEVEDPGGYTSTINLRKHLRLQLSAASFPYRVQDSGAPSRTITIIILVMWPKQIIGFFQLWNHELEINTPPTSVLPHHTNVNRTNTCVLQKYYIFVYRLLWCICHMSSLMALPWRFRTLVILQTDYMFEV